MTDSSYYFNNLTFNQEFMRGIIFILAVLLNLSAFAQSTPSFEQKLTGSQSKRWVFSKSQLTMGSKISPHGDCPFTTIIFNSANKEYFGVPCQDNQTVKGHYEIHQAGPEEHFIVINANRYEILIYTESKSVKKKGKDGKTKTETKEKEVLLLRKLPTEKTKETAEYYYYAE